SRGKAAIETKAVEGRKEGVTDPLHSKRNGFALESKFDPEVQLPHRSVGIEVLDDTAVRAVNAVIRGAEVNLVENIKGLEPELPSHAFGNQEVFKQRQVRVEESGTNERVPLATKVRNLGTLEGSDSLPIRQ